MIVGRSEPQSRASQRAKVFQKLEGPLPTTAELSPKKSEGSRRSSMDTKRGAKSGAPDQKGIRCTSPPNGDVGPVARRAVSADEDSGRSRPGNSSAGRRLAAVHKRVSAIASRNRGPAASVGVEFQGRSRSPTGAILGCRQSTLKGRSLRRAKTGLAAPSRLVALCRAVYGSARFYCHSFSSPRNPPKHDLRFNRVQGGQRKSNRDQYILPRRKSLPA
jgi:hypothetical protein